MYSGITYSPHQYTVSELYAWTHGLQDYEAAKERVANYIKTAYSSRRGITDITATPSVTDEGRALKEEAAKIPLQVGGCVSLSPEEAATLHSLLYKILETV